MDRIPVLSTSPLVQTGQSNALSMINDVLGDSPAPSVTNSISGGDSIVQTYSDI